MKYREQLLATFQCIHQEEGERGEREEGWRPLFMNLHRHCKILNKAVLLIGSA
jgi:hypothetical protein